MLEVSTRSPALRLRQSDTAEAVARRLDITVPRAFMNFYPFVYVLCHNVIGVTFHLYYSSLGLVAVLPTISGHRKLFTRTALCFPLGEISDGGFGGRPYPARGDEAVRRLQFRGQEPVGAGTVDDVAQAAITAGPRGPG